MKTQAVSKKAASILRRAKDSILKQPEKYDQGNFCGTAFCIAGHIIANEKSDQWKTILKSYRQERLLTLKELGIESKPYLQYELLSGGFTTSILAQKILGENIYIYSLFDDANKWPDPFAEEFYRAITDKERAEVAARRIEHFIETGE
jgi:hypothetical protein